VVAVVIHHVAAICRGLPGFFGKELVLW